MKTAEIRSRFLKFFQQRAHTIVPSAPLVPGNDPTLLFTNSGMVQFKNVFLGSEKPGYVRAADVQRCLRAGGKHNDLDQVGYTARHHTFFEMLGNWSFGDYFKREAISWAWELLTVEFKLPSEKLWVTVYHSDEEAYDLWHELIGVPAERIVRIGDNKGKPYASDNFWQMADTGPCGPCTEIFYDHGPAIAGGPPGSADEDGDRYIEIWNLVFMQFDRSADGVLSPLPAPCVDTGMGLERLAAVLQGKHSNYEIDLFQCLIQKAAQLTATRDLQNQSLRVIADHIRACAFLIVDGVLPSNEGRGYVLRRIIRRALRHGWMLGVRGTFFSKMLAPLIEQMGEAYPDLVAKQALLEHALLAEEQRFGETLEQGMKVFDEVLGRTSACIAGSDAFRLYDTYGFPLDLTADIARERGLTVDQAGFEVAMQQQRTRARAASRFVSKGQLPAELVSTLQPTVFLGYESPLVATCQILAMLRDGRQLAELGEGEEAVLILEQTPFYAESGGQVGDTGVLELAGGGRFVVRDTQKLGGVFHGHIGCWQGSSPLRSGAKGWAKVDTEQRQATVLNHSATHLLHAALRKVLGDHVSQKGSLVAPHRLRFDFSHSQPITTDLLRQVEALVNTEIRRNWAVETRQMAYQEALEFGAMALFGEKYGDQVRVLKMGDFSTELCGGTHVKRTGDIGLFKIISESGVASGVRRIEAVTGTAALHAVNTAAEHLEAIAGQLGCPLAEVTERLQVLLERQKKIERELLAARSKAAGSATVDLAAKALSIDGVRVVAARLDGLDAKGLREGVDGLKQKLTDAVICLASATDGKAMLVCGVSGIALQRSKAGEIVAYLAAQIGGKGGGRPDLAQGGGSDGPELDQALGDLPSWLTSRWEAR